MPETQPRIDAILDYWFGIPREYKHCATERLALWFGGDPAVNAYIAEQFAEDHRRAAAGDLDIWAETDEGLLALVIVLDQFSRNLYRNNSRAFDCDPQALALSLAAIAQGRDHQLLPLQRLFLYLPLEHAEDLDLQRRSVAKIHRVIQYRSSC